MNSPHDPELVDRSLDLPPTTHMQRYEKIIRTRPPYALDLNCFMEYETAAHEVGPDCPRYKHSKLEVFYGFLMFLLWCAIGFGPIILGCLMSPNR